jgi:hypothetical protein
MNNTDIIFRNKAFFNRTVFQACAVKTFSVKEAKNALEGMKFRYKNCVWAGIAYRVLKAEDCYEEIELLGRKILLLMTRMDAMNLTIGVSIWYSGGISNHDCSRMVLERVIDIINYLHSLVPEDLQESKPQVEYTTIDEDPIAHSDYLIFPDRPTPAPAPPFDYKVERLQSKIREIVSKLDPKELQTLHELSSHTIISKILHLLYCLLNTVPYTPKKLKSFYKNEKILEIITEFNPNTLPKRKIREINSLLKEYSNIDLSKIEQVSHSSLLILEYVKTIAAVIQEVPVPKPIGKTEVYIEPIVLLETRPLIYHPGSKPNRKKGKYVDVAEMVINNEYTIRPYKIPIKNNDTSEADLHFKRFNLNKSTLGRYSSVDLNTKFNQRSKNNIQASEQSLDFSLRVSKKSLDRSNKNLSIDDEIINRALKIKTQKFESFSDTPEVDILKKLNYDNIQKQPTELLLKFAEILREKRENHILIT